jgi:hypothetical protein
MKSKVLINSEEPTDVELLELMNEVAKEVKIKSELVKKQLSEKIVQEINNAKTRFKEKRL